MTKQPDPAAERKRAWLNRYQDSLRRQARLAFLIEDARSYATSIQSPGGMRTAPTGVHSDRVANAVQRIDELQREYSAEVECGCQIYAEIQTAIEALPDVMQTLVLYHRHLQCLKFDAICKKIDRSRATTTKLLHDALAALVVPEDYSPGASEC